MNDILKDIYESYDYRENETFEPIKIGCSITGADILDKILKNAPESADTFVEIANLMAEQQNSIAKNTSDISTEVQRAKGSEKQLEDSIEKAIAIAVSSAATYTDNQKAELSSSAQTNAHAIAVLSTKTNAVKVELGASVYAINNAIDELTASAKTNADTIADLSAKTDTVKAELAASVKANADAITDLSAKADTVKAELATSVKANADAVASEVSARTAADDELAKKLTNETERAEAAEAKISSNVSALSDEMTKSDSFISQNVQTILNYIKSENTTGETKINGKVNVTSEDDVTVYGIYKNDTAAETKIAGKSVTVKNVNAENTRLDIVGSGKTTIDTIVLNGDYPKASSNAQISVNNGDGNDVEIKNSTINQTSYNGIEIGLGSDSLPKNVVIDGIDFEGKLSNNAILVFGLKENGTLTIKNCHFESMSNCVRFSNKANATGITINIENCTVGNWDSNPTWAGFFIFEDYTSKDAEETEKNNLFGDGKITVNLDNVVCMGKKITNDSLKLGEQTADTFAYVYDHKIGYIKYPENINRYPNFTCK